MYLVTRNEELAAQEFNANFGDEGAIEKSFAGT